MVGSIDFGLVPNGRVFREVSKGINDNFVELANFNASFSAYGLTIGAAPNADAARTELGLVIGGDVQAQSEKLQAISDLSLAADRFIYWSSPTTPVASVISTWGRSILADADQAAGRAKFGLSLLVANGYAPASLATALANSQDVSFSRGAAVTLTATAQRLSQAVGGRLDLNGGKIVFDYSDTSNTVNFVANKLVNGTIEIATGRNIQRLLRFNERYALMRDMTIRSVDIIDNVNDSNDALIRPYGDDFLAENCTIENVDTTFLTVGKNGVFRDLTFRGCVRGVVAFGSVGGATPATGYVSGLKWYGTSSLATLDPGNNAIGGNWLRLYVDNCYVGPSEDLTTFPQGTGEHGIYVIGPGKGTEGDLSVTNTRIRRTGQCGLKMKDTGIIHAKNVHVSGTSWGNSPGLNEEAFRFQRANLVTGGGLHATKEIISGAPFGYGGFRHMFFSGIDNAIMLDESYAEGCYSGGVVFGIDDNDPLIGHGNYQLRVRHKNVGGPSLIIEDNAIINGEIIIYLHADGCPGPPIYIGAGVQYGTNGNIVVIGDYRRCSAAPPASTANVDLSRLKAF